MASQNEGREDDGSCNICMGHVPQNGGVYTAVRDFARALPSDVIDFNNRPIKNEADEIDTKLLRLPYRKFAPKRTAIFLPGESKDKATEFLSYHRLLIGHSLYLPHVHFLHKTALQAGKPYWAVPHGALDPYVFRKMGFLKDLWLKLRGYAYLSDARRVIFSTRREMEKASAKYKAENCCWIHWPLDPINIDSRSAKGTEFRRDHKIPEDKRILIYLGRMDSMKRPIEVVEAFLKACPKNGFLLMVGMDGDIGVKYLEKRFRGSPSVLFTGPLYGTDKDHSLFAADGFVSFSYRENFGYTTAEAASAGLPMVLSAGNDLGHDLPESTRWMLKDDSVESLVSAMTGFFSADESELKAKGALAREWTNRELTFAKFAETLQAWKEEDLQVKRSK